MTCRSGGNCEVVGFHSSTRRAKRDDPDGPTVMLGDRQVCSQRDVQNCAGPFHLPENVSRCFQRAK